MRWPALTARLPLQGAVRAGREEATEEKQAERHVRVEGGGEEGEESAQRSREDEREESKAEGSRGDARVERGHVDVTCLESGGGMQ